jgi:hypothetical protein
MNTTLSRIAVVAALCVAALSGCATSNTVVAEVYSYGEWPSEIKTAGGTYAVERLPSQQANAAVQDQVENAARPAIEARGLRPAPPDQADVLVQVGARLMLQYTYDPFASSLYWQSDWMWYGRRAPYWGPYRYWGPYGGWGPYWGPSYTDFPDYVREAGLLFRDRRSQKVVYETRARYASRNDSELILPALFSAAMQDFPGPAISPRNVTVPLGGDAVAQVPPPQPGAPAPLAAPAPPAQR